VCVCVLMEVGRGVGGVTGVQSGYIVCSNNEWCCMWPLSLPLYLCLSLLLLLCVCVCVWLCVCGCVYVCVCFVIIYKAVEHRFDSSPDFLFLNFYFKRTLIMKNCVAEL